MRDYEAFNTKLSIILAAGELFASKGFDGVTTRQIAKKANVNLGSMHYHFQSKEAIYIETFRFALTKGKKKRIQELDKKKSKIQTPKKLAVLILEVIEAFFEDVLLTKDPEWLHPLMARELTQPSSAFHIILEDLFKPEHEGYVSLYRAAKPDSEFDETAIWSFLIHAQAIFYTLGHEIVKTIVGENGVNKNFVSKISRITARMLILHLELPLPEELRLDRI